MIYHCSVEREECIVVGDIYYCGRYTLLCEIYIKGRYILKEDIRGGEWLGSAIPLGHRFIWLGYSFSVCVIRGVGAAIRLAGDI